MAEKGSERILLAHGGGGILMKELVERIVGKLGGAKGPLQDSATLPIGAGRIAFTTDSFVVSPLFFPGGDIGRLAVCGTVNDLAVSGARPLWLSLSFIVEEGLPFETFDRVLDSVASRRAGSGRERRHGGYEGRRARQGGRDIHQYVRHRRRAAGRRACPRPRRGRETPCSSTGRSASTGSPS